MMQKKLCSWFNAKVISTLPIFIAVNLAALAVWILGVSPEAMPLILGMIAAALVDFDNRLVGRLKNIAVMLVVFSFSTISVQLAIGQSVAFTLLLTLMAFVVTMFGAIGKRYSTVAFGALLVALYTVLTYTPNTPWILNPLLILLGAILYSLSSLFVFFLFPNRAVQENVGDVFSALADYFAEKAQIFDPDDNQDQAHQLPLAVKNAKVIQAFNACQTTLFYRIRGQQRRVEIMRMMKVYFSAQDIFEKVSADYFDYQQLAEKLKHTDLIFRIQRLLILQGKACADLAESLQLNTTYTYDMRIDRCLQGLVQSLAYYQQNQRLNYEDLVLIKTLIESLQAVDWQLRHIDNVQYQAEKYDLHPVQIMGFKNMWLAVRNNFTFKSPLFRHAIRLSLVVFVSCIIVESLQLHLGYWILLTAILVCQPNYYATKVRLKQRILGSLLGVFVASLLPYMQPTLVLDLGIIVITSSLFFFFRNNNYSYATFFITVQVLVSFYVMGFDIANAMFSRMADTLLGTVIAFVASAYLWPDWKYWKLNQVSLQSIKADAKYLLFIITQLQVGHCDPLKYRIARRQAQDNASNLSDIINIMNNDHKKYAERLPQAFELLQLNYTLLSYISALGAYRETMQKVKQSVTFTSGFYPLARKIIYVLAQIDHLTQTEFEENIHLIKTKLETFNLQDKQNKNEVENYFNVPLQQLNLISQLLPELYEAIQREKQLEENES